MHLRTAVLAGIVAGMAAGCGSSGSNSAIPTSPTNPDNPSLTTVFITNGVFSPNPVVVKVGQQVNWKNNDAIEHTATLAGMFDTGPIAPTSAHDVPVPMNTVGTFTFHCAIHANETGSIVVE
jgi:plastocyanin